tara:strand:+ start:497 stop:790 length:294 start_codon:yes stop_codon:yes gene_type:complete
MEGRVTGDLGSDNSLALIQWLLLKQTDLLKKADRKEISEVECRTSLMMYCWIASSILTTQFSVQKYRDMVEEAPTELSSPEVVLDEGLRFLVALRQR